MSVMDDVLLALARNEGEVTSKIINDLIEGHRDKRDKMLENYYRYTGEEVPILDRRFLDPLKVNNKLANDFMGDVIDTKIGYFMGNPVSYNIDKEAEGFEKKEELISDFKARNDIEDLDSETAKMAAICGYGARLCYIDKEGKERVMDVPGWEAIFVTDRSINEPQYALRYYEVKLDGRDLYRVEWYDDQYVTFYIGDKQGGYILDDTEEANPKPHLFDDVPLMGFPNNEELLGDCDKVLNLIDGYDNTISDVNSEIEQFRLAYMAFYGVEIDERTLEKAKRTGAFGLPAAGQGEQVKVEFITKMLDDAIIEHHLDRLESNIMRFAKSVNFADEEFSGNASGVAMKFKMLAMESKCITAERKFAAALRQMFRVLATAWAKKGIAFDADEIFFEFKRNFPLNLLDEAQTTVALKGMISEQTRLSLLSFVDDAEYEMELMEKDQQAELDRMVDLDKLMPDEPNEDDEE